jgi:hypothetical protein
MRVIEVTSTGNTRDSVNKRGPDDHVHVGGKDAERVPLAVAIAACGNGAYCAINAEAESLKNVMCEDCCNIICGEPDVEQ